jgi:hypothetical protein
LQNFANRIEVETASGKQTIALLAVRHPSARSNSKGQGSLRSPTFGRY